MRLNEIREKGRGFNLLLTTSILLLSSAGILPAQEDFLFHPESIDAGEIVYGVGLGVTFFPRSVVETEVRQAPLLEMRARYGLPVHFSIEGGIRSNIITNFVDLRGRYAFNLDPVILGGSFRIGWWYGFAPFDGFDVTATSWLNYPGVEVGFRRGDVRFGTLVEAQIITFLSIETDGIETEQSTNELGGYSFSFFAEQPFWDHTELALALRLNYSRSMYQAWLAFSASEEYLLYPEVSLHLLF